MNYEHHNNYYGIKAIIHIAYADQIASPYHAFYSLA